MSPVAAPRSAAARSGFVATPTAPRRGDPRRVRRSPGPRAPRRVSGPSASRRPAQTLGSRLVAAVSLVPAAAARGAVSLPGVGARTLVTLPDRRIVTRLIRGRSWIVLIALMLIGIVAMQVSMLKLNAGIGRAAERSATLERDNGTLRADVARLSSSNRIQRIGGQLGLVMPAAGAVRYVAVDLRHDASAATTVMRPPQAGGPFASAVTGSPAGGQSGSSSPAPASSTGSNGASGALSGQGTGTGG